MNNPVISLGKYHSFQVPSTFGESKCDESIDNDVTYTSSETDTSGDETNNNHIRVPQKPRYVKPQRKQKGRKRKRNKQKNNGYRFNSQPPKNDVQKPAAVAEKHDNEEMCAETGNDVTDVLPRYNKSKTIKTRFGKITLNYTEAINEVEKERIKNVAIEMLKRERKMAEKERVRNKQQKKYEKLKEQSEKRNKKQTKRTLNMLKRLFCIG